MTTSETRSMTAQRRTGFVVLIIVCLLQNFGCTQNANRGELGGRFLGGGSFLGSSPVLSPDGSKVFFSSPSPNTIGDICSMNTDGTGFTKILSDDYYEGYPDVSPCGQTLAHVSEVQSKPHLYIFDISEPGIPQKITSGSWTEFTPRFSRCGTKLAFCRHLSENPDDAWSREVFVIDLKSGAETRVTNDRYSNSPVTFSSDNEWLYFESLRLSGKSVSSSLWKKRWLEDGEPIQVLPFSYIGTAVVLPEERGFVFLDDRKQSYNYEIYRCSSDGLQVEQLTDLNTYIGDIRYGVYKGQDAVTFIADSNRRGYGNICILLIDSKEFLSVGPNFNH